MKTKRRKLLQEDECAQDAIEYFEKVMERDYRLTLKMFFTQGQRQDYETGVEYFYKDFVLSFFAEDPFYLLEQIVEEPSHG